MKSVLILKFPEVHLMIQGNEFMYELTSYIRNDLNASCTSLGFMTWLTTFSECYINSKRWKKLIQSRGRSFIFSTATPVPVVAAAYGKLKYFSFTGWFLGVCSCFQSALVSCTLTRVIAAYRMCYILVGIQNCYVGVTGNGLCAVILFFSSSNTIKWRYSIRNLWLVWGKSSVAWCSTDPKVHFFMFTVRTEYWFFIFWAYSLPSFEYIFVVNNVSMA